MTAVCVFVVLSALLVAGKIVRMKMAFLQRLYLPSSVKGSVKTDLTKYPGDMES